jgi:hypothetical protein
MITNRQRSQAVRKVLGRPGVASDAILPTLPLLTPPAEAVEEQPVGLGLRIPARARSVTLYLPRASNETSYPSAAAGPAASALPGFAMKRCRRASWAPRFPDELSPPGRRPRWAFSFRGSQFSLPIAVRPTAVALRSVASPLLLRRFFMSHWRIARVFGIKASLGIQAR